MEIALKDMELIREALVDKVASLRDATSQGFHEPKLEKKLRDAQRLLETFEELILRQ